MTNRQVLRQVFYWSTQLGMEHPFCALMCGFYICEKTSKAQSRTNLSTFLLKNTAQVLNILFSIHYPFMAIKLSVRTNFESDVSDTHSS